jgi:hypothetical protein
VVEMGVAERHRIGIGGHSYGAFMTANLLAHSDLFRAGIARSGAYNRTLTPYGFQAEQRTFCEATDTYMRMSPFTFANRVNQPILLIHGAADDNSGTFPMQSERLHNAIAGLGGTSRLVMLPHESHGYRARESVLHALAEMIEWFDITVGQLIDSIDDRGLTDNTMVVYLTDNGWIQNPDADNQFIWPSKQSPFDMGIRTHMTYKWPDQITPRMDTTTFVSTNDMVPTVLEAVGIEPDMELPGVNVLDRHALDTREAVFSADYHHDIADVHNPTESLEHRVVLKSPWKLILPKEEGGPQNVTYGGGDRIRFIDMIEGPELYHIVDDPRETNNVADEIPEVVEELKLLIEEWWQPVY